ncbi:MAG: hypothetical protein A3E83_04865 [Gammaproteobacteria bacterium RIFCSPHIGHO2_12_FULL_41_20]|nr:MAG: hypothetical protein A3E83_04865 [Gammaproteobacteria bacterium RIFCSPHIGHO2_12_FULL_41_20]
MPTKPTIAVFAPNPVNLAKATAIAQQLNLPYFAPGQPYDFLLLIADQYIGIQSIRTPPTNPFYIDFLSAKLHYRQTQASLRKEALARAIGIKPQENPVIIDATAGLARDSFILASLGYNITLLERSPILHLLISDAIQRAAQDPIAAPIINKLHLIQADAISWLQNQHAANLLPHVIYLDPMFPERRKSAQVKKDMQVLQSLVGNDSDTEQLFAVALACAAARVVVKRPRLAPLLTKRLPTFQLIGKSARFDIYITR